MLDPRQTRQTRQPAGRATLLAGAFVLLAAGGALAYWGIDWQRHGCGCDGSSYPSWSWVVLLALAAAALVTATLLLMRAMRMRG
jgi:hypothetical protein